MLKALDIKEIGETPIYLLFYTIVFQIIYYFSYLEKDKKKHSSDKKNLNRGQT